MLLRNTSLWYSNRAGLYLENKYLTHLTIGQKLLRARSPEGNENVNILQLL